ncbi:FHA domain-containing protein [Polyangium jinanense]|uniref:FHA domain-containing protein n=1 Tax=Polyangium jinanense TaxID=2829994 RepID=A0A9X3XAJ3_9BACT|nr:FHA domain-containing protein [Polyangium jinanense]MDC3959286.1 FHA domain-containing protein [Polyangium jinanense]MDC3985695.1 FHA domain-containing protein [Polyangium jinanense]
MATSFALVVLAELPGEIGRVIPLAEGAQVFGRTEGADIRLRSDTVSRRHARITVEEGRVTIEDVASTSGTFVNDELLRASQEILPGARIRIGQIVLELVRAEDGVPRR